MEDLFQKIKKEEKINSWESKRKLFKKLGWFSYLIFMFPLIKTAYLFILDSSFRLSDLVNMGVWVIYSLVLFLLASFKKPIGGLHLLPQFEIGFYLITFGLILYSAISLLL